MPTLSVYVDVRTLSILTELSQRNGRSIDEMASAAIESEALRALPPPRRSICSTYHSRAVGMACQNCGYPKEDHAHG